MVESRNAVKFVQIIETLQHSVLSKAELKTLCSPYNYIMLMVEPT